jgi:excisionase family DNA binding protein
MSGATSAQVALNERHDPLLTAAQAGDYLGTGERFIRRLITQRRISYVKLGKYVRLQRSTLDAFIEAGRVTSEGQCPDHKPCQGLMLEHGRTREGKAPLG